MKRYSRLIIIIITLIVAAIFYLGQYSIDVSNLESEIGNHIKKENVIVHIYKEIEIEDDFYLFVNVEFDNKNGIVELVKGINNKYRFNTAYFSDEYIDCVNVLIGDIHHLFVYGKTDKVISKLIINGRTVSYYSEDINDTNILIVKDSLLRINEIYSYEFNYSNGQSETIELYDDPRLPIEYEDFVNSGNQGQVKIGVILILFFGYMISFIFKKKGKYKGFEGSDKLPVKHRIN